MTSSSSLYVKKSIIPDTSASDFEEHLRHGLGKDADDTDIHDVAGNCEEEDLMRKTEEEGGLCP